VRASLGIPLLAGAEVPEAAAKAASKKGA